MNTTHVSKENKKTYKEVLLSAIYYASSGSDVDEAPAAAAAPVNVKADAKVEETKAAKIVTVPRNGRSTRNIGFRSEAKLVKLVNAAPLVSAAVPRHHERPELNNDEELDHATLLAMIEYEGRTMLASCPTLSADDLLSLLPFQLIPDASDAQLEALRFAISLWIHPTHTPQSPPVGPVDVGHPAPVPRAAQPRATSTRGSSSSSSSSSSSTHTNTLKRGRPLSPLDVSEEDDGPLQEGRRAPSLSLPHTHTGSPSTFPGKNPNSNKPNNPPCARELCSAFPSLRRSFNVGDEEMLSDSDDDTEVAVVNNTLRRAQIVDEDNGRAREGQPILWPGLPSSRGLSSAPSSSAVNRKASRSPSSEGNNRSVSRGPSPELDKLCDGSVPKRHMSHLGKHHSVSRSPSSELGNNHSDGIDENCGKRPMEACSRQITASALLPGEASINKTSLPGEARINKTSLPGEERFNKTSLSGGGDGGGGDGTWSCSQCTFINSLVDTLCIMCSSSAPAARKRTRRNTPSGSGSDNGTGRTWIHKKSKRHMSHLGNVPSVSRSPSSELDTKQLHTTVHRCSWLSADVVCVMGKRCPGDGHCLKCNQKSKHGVCGCGRLFSRRSQHALARDVPTHHTRKRSRSPSPGNRPMKPVLNSSTKHVINIATSKVGTGVHPVPIDDSGREGLLKQGSALGDEAVVYASAARWATKAEKIAILTNIDEKLVSRQTACWEGGQTQIVYPLSLFPNFLDDPFARCLTQYWKKRRMQVNKQKKTFIASLPGTGQPLTIKSL